MKNGVVHGSSNDIYHHKETPSEVESAAKISGRRTQVGPGEPDMVWSRLLSSTVLVFFFSSRRRHTRFDCDWSSDVCSSDLGISSMRSYEVNRLSQRRHSRRRRMASPSRDSRESTTLSSMKPQNGHFICT